MEALGDYLREIEQRFVALRGRGFALSAKDVGRVLAWQAEGVPLRVVLSILEEAMRRWRADGARRAPTLGGLERSVDAAMKQRAERVADAGDGGGEGPVVREAAPSQWEVMRRAVEAAGADQNDPRVRSLLRHFWTTLKREEEARADAWTTAARMDGEMIEALRGLLTETEKSVMHEESRNAAARAGPRMSDEARAERASVESARLVRARFGVPELVGALLDDR